MKGRVFSAFAEATADTQTRPEDHVERAPKENRFEFVVLASQRARQLLKGALPREAGNRKIGIAQKEILRRKVVKIDDEQ